jgi:hypothetical protein
MNETHDGNMNKSKAPMPEKSEGTYGNKMGSRSLPKAEAVRTATEDKGACVKAAQKQNSSDEKPYMKGGRNVIPNESNESICCECGCKDCDCEG